MVSIIIICTISDSAEDRDSKRRLKLGLELTDIHIRRNFRNGPKQEVRMGLCVRDSILVIKAGCIDTDSIHISSIPQGDNILAPVPVELTNLIYLPLKQSFW